MTNPQTENGRGESAAQYCPYKAEGYESRADYLRGLADDFGVDPQTVFALASILGKTEDFDGLVCAVEDASMGIGI